MISYIKLNIKKLCTIPLVFCVLSSIIIAQYSPKIQSEINQYDKLIEENINGGNKSEAAKYMNKAAFLLWNNHHYDGAISYFEKALEIIKSMGNANGQMVICYNLGMLYSDMEKYKDALPHLENGLRVSRSLNAKESIASGLTNVSIAYQGLGEHKKAIEHLEEAVTLASELNDLKLLRRCYGMIYESYEELGQNEKAYKYFDLYSSFDKEIKKVEMEQVKDEAATQVSQANLEKEKTEQVLKETEDSLKVVEQLTREQRLEIEIRDLRLRENQLELEAQNAQIKATRQRYFLSLGILSIVVLSVLLLLRQNRAINRQKIEIQMQRDKLEGQNKNITASINYAQTIQAAILPDLTQNTNGLGVFMLYWPKDIVSGDFYWHSYFPATKKENETIFLAVVDCTGHGVPGAFMSMIGNRILNEIVNERRIFEPSLILENLNKDVIEALRQEQTENHDGMDVCLCRFERLQDEFEVTFSGAKRPLYCIPEQSEEVVRYKGDRISIGGVKDISKAQKFTQVSFKAKKNDLIYLSSDGIIDQNGSDRKRFGSPRLEEELVKMKDMDFVKQKPYIEGVMKDFIREQEQRDDISLMGIKITL